MKSLCVISNNELCEITAYFEQYELIYFFYISLCLATDIVVVL